MTRVVRRQWDQQRIVQGAVAAALLLTAYGTVLWAVDTASMWVYALTLVLIVSAARLMFLAVKK